MHQRWRLALINMQQERSVAKKLMGTEDIKVVLTHATTEHGLAGILTAKKIHAMETEPWIYPVTKKKVKGNIIYGNAFQVWLGGTQGAKGEDKTDYNTENVARTAHRTKVSRSNFRQVAHPDLSGREDVRKNRRCSSKTKTPSRT